jgi:amino acid permease
LFAGHLTRHLKERKAADFYLIHRKDYMSSSLINRAQGPAKTLSSFDAIAIIVGVVIGAGIFKTPSIVAAHSGSEAAVVLLWLLGGLISFVGALCYAELTTAYPDAGGDYHFIHRAFGSRPAFLFAWARMTVIQTGSIAMLVYYRRLRVASLQNRGSFFVMVCILYHCGSHRSQRCRNQAGQVAAETSDYRNRVELISVVSAGLSLNSPQAEPANAAGFSVPGKAMIFVLLTYGGE